MSDDTEGQEFLAPDVGGWHYTTMRDWIAVCPDIGATAIRLYWIIRSIMHEKGDKSKRLSLDELCWLLPGVNSKPTSVTRIKDALRELERAGLVSNPEGAVTRQWVTDPATGKQTKENFRRWQIHDFAQEGYGGWRSAIAKLKAYPGVGWQGTEGRKSASQSSRKLSTAPSPAETPVMPGHTEGRISAQPGRNSDQTGRNSGDYSAPTCEDAPSKESFQGISLTNQPPGTASGGEQALTSPGWLDGPPPQPQAPAAPGPGVRFLAELDVRHRPDQHAVRRLTPLVEALLDGDWSWDDLKRAVTAGADTGDNPPGVVISRIVNLERESRTEPLSRSEAAEKRRRADIERAAAARAAADAKTLAIANCTLCDALGYIGLQLCDHNPSQDQTNEAGLARAWAAIKSKPGGTATQPKTATQAS